LEIRLSEHVWRNVFVDALVTIVTIQVIIIIRCNRLREEAAENVLFS